MIVVTGFEPFGGHPSNPSEEIAKTADGRVIVGWQVVEHEEREEEP